MTDPRQVLEASRMSRFQIIAVALTIGLNALDGFDVLSISFASPGIAKEWGIDRGALGFVLAMELIGMAFGSVLLGGLADKIGRRPTILGCLVVMAVGMFAATTASNVTELSIWRVITGLGIGGMLASINAVAAEYASAAQRKICIALMAIGYPIGGVVGGQIAAVLLAGNDWRAVFIFGAIATAAFIPLVWFLMPETPAFLIQKRPPGALEKVNAVLVRAGHAPVDSLPVPDANAPKKSLADIFSPALLRVTVLVTLAYFMHIATFYYIIKWVPKIVVDLGYSPAAAAGVLVWANVGGATGGLLLGLFGQRFGIKPVTLIALIGGAGAVAAFGLGQPDLAGLSMICALCGFFVNAGIVGLYTIFAEAFPTHVRATGTGFAIGIGRGGSALAPIIAGFLFQGGLGLFAVSLIMACGSLIAFFCIAALKIGTPARS